MSRPLAPGSVLGVLGSGQLGRMMAQAAKALGFRVHVYSPEFGSPAGAMADREWVGPWGDTERLEEFARSIAVCTLEFENVPVEALSQIARTVPVCPDVGVLGVTQDRLREKAAMAGWGIPVTSFVEVQGAEDLEDASNRLGFPMILKTARCGYDGKGQRLVRAGEDLRSAWIELGRTTCIAEAWVDFSGEYSVIVARGFDGATCVYDPVFNEHRHHILDCSSMPCGLAENQASAAKELALRIAGRLNLAGVLAVELFLTRDGRWVVNELAPRPHNSGHLTIEACVTSQFEQQVRVAAGLPLGETRLHRPAAMVNLLGELWEGGEPHWSAVSDRPDAHVHLYGKAEPRPGRKMGHLTVLDSTFEQARRRALDLRERLRFRG